MNICQRLFQKSGLLGKTMLGFRIYIYNSGGKWHVRKCKIEDWKIPLYNKSAMEKTNDLLEEE